MGKDSRNEMEKSMLSPQAQQKFDELVALLAKERYGTDGPPIETTFAEIEQFGHQAGRMLGRSLDEHLSDRHAEHFQEGSCPTCGRDFFPQRSALAIDGGSYSPQVLIKAIVASAHVSSYPIGSKLLEELAGISISFTRWNTSTQQRVAYEATRKNSGGFICSGARRVGKVVWGK